MSIPKPGINKTDEIWNKSSALHSMKNPFYSFTTQMNIYTIFDIFPLRFMKNVYFVILDSVQKKEIQHFNAFIEFQFRILSIVIIISVTPLYFLCFLKRNWKIILIVHNDFVWSYLLDIGVTWKLIGSRNTNDRLLVSSTNRNCPQVAALHANIKMQLLTGVIS